MLKYMFGAVALSVFAMASVSPVQAVVIEAGATLGTKQQPISHNAADSAARLIRLYGYSCNSISSMNRFLWGRGFHVYCNRFNYGYELEDKGGRWTVKVK